jgi:hypothetical protein
MWRAVELTRGDDPAAEGDLVTPLNVRSGDFGSRSSQMASNVRSKKRESSASGAST